MTDRHRTTDPRLDDDDPEVPEPTGPEPREPSDNQTLSSPINELESRLFAQRRVLVFGAITDKVARDVTGRLLALAGASDKPIDLFVNSPGGYVESGDTIHDMRVVPAGANRGSARSWPPIVANTPFGVLMAGISGEAGGPTRAWRPRRRRTRPRGPTRKGSRSARRTAPRMEAAMRDNGAIAHRGVSLLREVRAGSSPAPIRRLSHPAITQFRP
jgi:hypothetical protein